jgi:energy-converting hydrogenase A subunit R
MINSDWEGPWVTADHARSMVEFALPQIGGRVFDGISEYDDYRFYIVGGNGYGRKYEPGDTLGLIAPILIAFGVTEKDLIDVAAKNANFIDGAKEAIRILKSRHEMNVITTSYRQYIEYSAKQAGISENNIYGTYFPINDYRVDEKDKALVKEWVQTIANLPKLDIGPESKISDLKVEQKKAVEKLDHFFFELLPKTSFVDVLNEVKPIGGSRKYEAVLKFMRGKSLSSSVTIGDSITDVVMLEETEKAGGLAVCFNGNSYAMRHSNISIVSDNCMSTAAVADIFENSDMETLRKIVGKWSPKSLKQAVEAKVLSKEICDKLLGAFPSKLMEFPFVFDLDDGKDLNARIETSKKFRKIVRGKEIGSLG